MTAAPHAQVVCEEVPEVKRYGLKTKGQEPLPGGRGDARAAALPVRPAGRQSGPPPGHGAPHSGHRQLSRRLQGAAMACGRQPALTWSLFWPQPSQRWCRPRLPARALPLATRIFRQARSGMLCPRAYIPQSLICKGLCRVSAGLPELLAMATGDGGAVGRAPVHSHRGPHRGRRLRAPRPR